MMAVVNEDLLNEIKCIIRSLVIPHPKGIGLKRLCNEYFDIEGKEIPYRELGFPSLTSLLRSIPDTVRMYGDLQDIHTVVLFPVANEDTAHIISLVSAQNKSKERGPPRTRPSFPTGNWRTGGIRAGGRGMSRGGSRGGGRVGRTIGPRLAPRAVNPIPVANYLRPGGAGVVNGMAPAVGANYIRTGSTGVVNGMARNPVSGLVNQMSQKFANFSITKPTSQIPEPPPGMSRRLNRSDPDIKVNGVNNGPKRPSSNGIPADVKEKISRLMAMPDMEDGLMLFNFAPRYRHQYKESFDFENYGFDNLAECLKTVPQLIQMMSVGTSTFKLMPVKAAAPVVTTTATVNDKPTFNARPTTNATIRPLLSSTALTNGNPLTITSTATARTVTRAVTTTTAPKPILSTFALNLRAADINAKSMVKPPIISAVVSNGINDDDTQSVASDDSIFSRKSLPKIKSPEPQAPKKPEPEGIKEPGADANTCFRLKQIPDQTKARIMKLIDAYMPVGIALSQFLNLYNMNYEQIDLRQYRVSDTSDLFQMLRTELPITVKMVDGVTHVFLKPKEEVREWVGDCCRQQRYIIPIVFVDTIANVVLPGDKYTMVTPPAAFEAGNNEYVAAFIASAQSPSEIFIQFKGKEYHSALEKLMDDLEFYDTVPEEVWSLPYEFVTFGMPCIARYPGDKFWHRARITRVYANQKRVVNVSFIDYGGMTVTDYKNLRLMRRDFLSLPVQALKVGLYGIKPILGDKCWTTSARDKVLRFSKPNYALATTLIEYKKGIPQVAMCDTNTMSDIFIHSVLINDKHALSDDTALDANTVDDLLS